MIEIFFSMAWLDPTFWRRVVQEFNRLRQGQIQVIYRHFSMNQNEYHDALQQMFEGRGRRIDVIGSDIMWTAEFADKRWIANLSSRFPPSERQQFLPASAFLDPHAPPLSRGQVAVAPDTSGGGWPERRLLWRIQPVHQRLLGRGPSGRCLAVHPIYNRRQDSEGAGG
jgi:hypothetical protein